jgi:hypothetical protein
VGQRAVLGPAQPLGKRLSLEVLHDQVGRTLVLADIVESADVWVIQCRDGAPFPIEALAKLRIAGKLRGKNLDRDRAVEPRVARLVDLAHAARAKGGLDLVRAEAETRLEWHAVEALIIGTLQPSDINGFAALRCSSSSINVRSSAG